MLELANKGVNATDIAKSQGVAISTITRYLQAIDPQLQAIRRYSSNKADTLALSQLKSQAIGNIIQDLWLSDPDKYLIQQDVMVQKEIFRALQGSKTYDHNQERLERGQATSIADNQIRILLDMVTGQNRQESDVIDAESAQDAEIRGELKAIPLKEDSNIK